MQGWDVQKKSLNSLRDFDQLVAIVGDEIVQEMGSLTVNNTRIGDQYQSPYKDMIN